MGRCKLLPCFKADTLNIAAVCIRQQEGALAFFLSFFAILGNSTCENVSGCCSYSTEKSLCF